MMSDPDNKLDDLSWRIDAAKSHKVEKENQRKDRSGHSNAQIGMEFVLSILVGGYAGYLLDSWLETSPLFLISLFFLGVAAGFMSIYRASKNIGSGIGYSELHRQEKQAKNLPKNENIDS